MDHLTFSDDIFHASDVANVVATVEGVEIFNCIALPSGIVHRTRCYQSKHL